MYSSEAFYTHFAKSYANYAANKKRYLDAVNSFIVSEAGSAKTMIDVGSGDGKRTLEISNFTKIQDFTLLDDSHGMIALAQNIPGAKIVEADISYEKFFLEQKFDTVLCLWNVLGHIKSDARETALKNIASLVAKEGAIFLDVNNRYNAAHYGFKAAIKNILKDIFFPSKTNGDFNLNVKTEQGEIHTQVHIFSPFEMDYLLKSAGLKIIKKKYIDYKSGENRKSFWGGQLVYKLKKV